ncbi:PAS domain-containing protein [Thermoleptolyngbya sp. M55_K2018_002]|uniref:PAS domain-containing protein n=1 Tax=Thermoleptolyngbya sp. M55_K2018_002 TaxID=2747808 RepID=UPI0025E618C3|nr:PAS domain S-box protein [Thermoleptolyngbya sp. M55_K2018_002]
MKFGLEIMQEPCSAPSSDPAVEQSLRLEIAQLRAELETLRQEKSDLEILLEMTTEHSDTVEAELQREAEETLRESEHRLAQFLEAVPVGVFVVDGGGRSYYANRMAQQILGYIPITQVATDELSETYQVYQAGAERLYPTADLPIVRALTGESSTVDDMVLRQGDRTVPLEVWASPIYNEKGQVVYAIAAFQDITERKRAEDALRIAEANYRSIFENAAEGIYQTTPDGQYLSANPAIARMYGYDSPAELMASVGDISQQVYVDPQERDRFRSLLTQHGEVKNFEYQVYRRDGTVMWLLESARSVCDGAGRVLYYEGMCIDITQRKQQEQALQQRVQQLQIEIDEAKRQRQVAEITQTDYFRQIQQEAEQFKRRLAE